MTPTQELLTKQLVALLKEKDDKRLEMCRLEYKIDGAVLAYWGSVCGLRVGGLIRENDQVFRIEHMRADGHPMGKPSVTCFRWLKSKRWSRIEAVFDRFDHYAILSPEEIDSFFLANPKAMP